MRGAEPGDLLEVKLLAIDPDPFDAWGYTVQVPGFGFLRDLFPEPYIAHWHFTGDAYAELPQIPGVRIRCAPFPGIIGPGALAPSCASAPPDARPSWRRVAASCSGRARPTLSRPRRRSPRPGCGRCRRARRPAISTSSN